MNTHQEIDRFRSLVIVTSVFGLCIAIALGIGVVTNAPGWRSVFMAMIFSAPFTVALVASWFSRPGLRRAGWAVAAVLAGAVGIALVTSVGIFYLALAAGFTWTAIASGRAPNHAGAT